MRESQGWWASTTGEQDRRPTRTGADRPGAGQAGSGDARGRSPRRAASDAAPRTHHTSGTRRGWRALGVTSLSVAHYDIILILFGTQFFEFDTLLHAAWRDQSICVVCF